MKHLARTLPVDFAVVNRVYKVQKLSKEDCTLGMRHELAALGTQSCVFIQVRHHCHSQEVCPERNPVLKLL